MSEKLSIRDAVPADEAGVLGLLEELARTAGGPDTVTPPGVGAAFREILAKGKGSILLADEGGILLGMVTLSYPLAIRCGGVYACIEEFVVGPQARGKGVGGLLLEAAVRRAREMGCAEIQVNRPSEAGYPVYLRHGWQDLGKHLNLAIQYTV